MKSKFSKKLLGKKIRTQMVYHRIVIKAYDNGLTIKPLGMQGLGDKCPQQEALFLTNENIGYLKQFLDMFHSAKAIINEMDERLEDEFVEEIHK